MLAAAPFLLEDCGRHACDVIFGGWCEDQSIRLLAFRSVDYVGWLVVDCVCGCVKPSQSPEKAIMATTDQRARSSPFRAIERVESHAFKL